MAGITARLAGQAVQALRTVPNSGSIGVDVYWSEEGPGPGDGLQLVLVVAVPHPDPDLPAVTCTSVVPSPWVSQDWMDEAVSTMAGLVRTAQKAMLN